EKVSITRVRQIVGTLGYLVTLFPNREPRNCELVAFLDGFHGKELPVQHSIQHAVKRDLDDWIRFLSDPSNLAVSLD
ncbi:hypothetical protein JCM11491_005332, partial [Sporobolomyces phaffii]